MDWRDIQDDKEKYQAYLCSREWAELREAVRKRSDGKCERCFLRPMDAVHHLTYARKYAEDYWDLQAICNECHDFTHGKIDDDPRLAEVPPSFDSKTHADGTLLVCPFCNAEEIGILEFNRCDDHDTVYVAQCRCGSCNGRFEFCIRNHQHWSWIAVRNCRPA